MESTVPGFNPLGCDFTGNRSSVFHSIKNQNWPLIGQRKITPPKFRSAHQSRALSYFDEMKFKSVDQSGGNFDFDEMKNRKSVIR